MSTGHSLSVLVLCQVGSDTMWSGGEDKTIRVWAMADSSLKQVIKGHKGHVVSIIEMGVHVWSSATDSTIMVWDAISYARLYNLGNQGG